MQSTPTYDHAPNPDKQWILQVTNKMLPIHKKFTDLLMTKRLQTLQSVDQAVERLYHELKQLGELDNTYIVYTSDHGYHLGQFGLIKGKSFPFEFDVRVPFLVRGPGVEPGTVIDDIVLNLDIAPTFLHMAGVPTPAHMDGKSFLELLMPPRSRPRLRMRPRPDTFLIESSGRRETPEQIAEAKLRAANKYSQEANLGLAKTNTVHSVANSKIKNHNLTRQFDLQESAEDDDELFIEGDDGEIEVEDDQLPDVDDFDFEDDEVSEHDTMPGDDMSESNLLRINNAGSIPQGVAEQFDNTLPRVAGSTRAARLAAICAHPSSRRPCVHGQRWRCVQIAGRWRRHKCKYEVKNIEIKPQSRKCACFTPGGVVYTRLDTNGANTSPQIASVHDTFVRNKRSIKNKVETDEISVDDFIKNHPSFGHLKSVNENDDEFYNLQDINSVIKHIDKTILEMNESLNILSNNISDEDKSHRVKRIKRNSRSVRLADVLINPSRKTFYNNRTSNLECKVEHNGMVNCSKAIYKDMKIWHASRLSVEDQIRKLKIKLDDLKEIRRHLKETRPDGVIPSENPEESDANTRQTNDNVSENKHKINTNQQSGFSLNTNRVMTHIIETTSESNIQETKHQSTASSINSLKTNNEDDVSESTSSSYPSTPSYTSRHHHSRNNSHHRENTQTQKTTTAFPSSTYNFDTSETMESEYSSINSTDFDFDKYLLQVQNETSMLNESNSDVNVTFASNAVEFTPSFTNNDIKSVSTSATDTPINTPSTSPTPRRFLPQEKYDMNRIIPALGPTRLDINTYGESHGKINNFGALNGTEEERLPPFYIENEDQHMCYCEQDRPRGKGLSKAEELAREERRRLKEERIKKRRRKARKRAKHESQCYSERMNCFSHDSDHWRTEPRWTLEPFCFCMNANNNTYSCIRTINSTHNFLYCEFVTGLITFYNLRIDPFETQNREKYLTPSERSFLHNQLEDLKRCKGKSCSVYSNQNAITDQMNNQRNINRQQANSFRNYHDPMSATAAIAIAGPSALHLVAADSKRIDSQGKVVKPWRKRKAWRRMRRERQRLRHLQNQNRKFEEKRNN